VEDVVILSLLVWAAVAIVRTRDLFTAVMLTGIYSFLGASWMLILDAPDVSFTEAAVGAGISVVLMLATLSRTGVSMTRRTGRRHLSPLLVVSVTGAILVYGTVDMPRIGDPEGPAQRYPQPSYVERTEKDIQIPNVVTAVLASYRGYDTLGESVVIFTAAVGVILLLRSPKPKPEAG
jgi:multicomponent Na+:H+ antiporter subunit B